MNCERFLLIFIVLPCLHLIAPRNQFQCIGAKMQKSVISGLLAITLVGTTLVLSSNIPVEAAQSCGKASWYALNSKTASGEQMNPSAMTAAHPTYRFGTKVRVTNKRNGRSVIVRINDRGPFVKGRIVDVSKAAARKLGFIRSGHTSVCITRVS